MFTKHPRAVRRAFGAVLKSAAAALALAAVAGCSGDVNPVRDVVVGAGVGAKPPEGPDFVAQSRPPSLDYLPVGVAKPPREKAAKVKSQVEAAEAEMEAVRAANQQKAQEAVALGAATPPAAAPKVAPIR